MTFTYEYDFGDNWGHTILVEKIFRPLEELKHPVCLKGKRSAPPEDCGGEGGYYHLLKVIGDPSMTHGTPIIMQPGDQNSCLVVSEDITVEFFDMNIDHWIQGQVYERVAPAVFQANSVGKITGA